MIMMLTMNDGEVSWCRRLCIDKCYREDVPVTGVEAYFRDIEMVLARLRSRCAQFDIDGTHNVWIVKPGAKSRGRGKYENSSAPLFICIICPSCNTAAPQFVP